MKLFGNKAVPKKAKHPVEVGGTKDRVAMFKDEVRDGTFHRVLACLPERVRSGFERSTFDSRYDVHLNQLIFTVVLRHTSGMERTISVSMPPEALERQPMGRLVTATADRLGGQIVQELIAFARERANSARETDEAAHEADYADALGAEESAPDDNDIYPEWDE